MSKKSKPPVAKRTNAKSASTQRSSKSVAAKRKVSTVQRKNAELTGIKKILPDLVITPGGYRHKSLFHILKPGEIVVPDKNIRPAWLRGPLAKTPPWRTGRRYLPSFGGWITSSSWDNSPGNPIMRFVTTWQVPPPPQTESGQLVYLFNGLEDVPSIPFTDPQYLLQPVLQWGVSPDGGGPYWAVASWFVDHSTGDAHRTSPVVSVNVGDTLTGVMTSIGQSDQGFSYSCEFAGIPGTMLSAVAATELRRAVVTLEAHEMTQCSDYPNAPMTAMNQVQIQTTGGAVTPTWTKNDQVTDCGAHTSILNNGQANVEIDFCYQQPNPT